MAYETIQLEMRDDAVAIISLNRPAALNALTVAMGTEFVRALTEAQAGGARAVVVTGAGRSFCAGGDLREMQEIAANEGRIEAFFDAPLRLLHDVVRTIRKVPIPVIAAVNGHAAGAGCNLALSCDIVVAGQSAKFNQAFVKIGLSPDCGGTYFLPRLVGWKRAAEMLMTGDVVDATRAEQIGMINRVVPDDEVMTEALGIATKLAAGPTATIGRIKTLLDQSA
ncbi:MAG: enoyl-CoA hydratase-related protein, partial [Gammaproteobacteria bacterium]